VQLVAASSVSRRLLGEDEVTGRVKLAHEVTLPIEAGEVMGELEFFQDDVGLGSVPLIAAQSLSVATFRMILDQRNGPWFEALPLGRLLIPAA
jgi:hypothetical protein